MVHDIQSQFRQEEIFKIAAPDLVQANSQGVGQTVSSASFEPLRVLEPSGGSDLGAGVNLRDLSRPGSGVSDAAPGTSRWEEERAQARLEQAHGHVPVGSRLTQNEDPNPATPRYLTGAPQLMPGISNAQRDQIRGDTAAAVASVSSMPASKGSELAAASRLFGKPDFANTTSRLFGRYPEKRQ